MQLLIPCGFSISSHLQFSQSKSSGSLADWSDQPSLVLLVCTRGTWLIPNANFHLSGCNTAMFLCFLLDSNGNTHMPVFPLPQKSYRHECILSPFAATLHKSRSTEKGKIWCEFMGKRGKTCDSRVPKPSQPPHGNGRILVFGDFAFSPPDTCNAHMEVSELSFLKSLRKLISMILMRDAAHSDQDLELWSFSAGCLNIPPKETTLLCAQSLTRLTAPHRAVTSEQIYRNIPSKATKYSSFCATWITLHWEPFRNFFFLGS